MRPAGHTTQSLGSVRRSGSAKWLSLLPFHSLMAVTNSWPFDGEMSRRRGDPASLVSVDTGQKERGQAQQVEQSPHKIKTKPYRSAVEEEKETCLRVELD